MKERDLPPLPQPDILVDDVGTAWCAKNNPELASQENVEPYFTAQQMREYVLADRAAAPSTDVRYCEHCTTRPACGKMGCIEMSPFIIAAVNAQRGGK